MHPEDERHSPNKRPASDADLEPTRSKRRKGDDDPYGRSSHPSRTRLPKESYTIGWVTALPIEMAAARCMLDEIHADQGNAPDDNNTYIWGSLHNHNVIVACLPTDGYGTNNAAIVANNMRRTFPSLRMFLMVGIGGGAGRSEIRLGDVVVSTGVIQYDLGKTIQQGFQSTGTIRQPAQASMTAVSKLRACHESESSKIPSILAQLRDRYPLMDQYAQCEQLKDLLFDSDYDHAISTASCEQCDQTRLLERPARPDKSPQIHYGIIASGNQVIKDARTRDRLARQFNALCFEMEAAGLMDSLQSLVIRGICDYSDSHKRKEWQKYAAATAAAYANELLAVIPACDDLEGGNKPETREVVIERRQELMDLLSFEGIDARYSSIRTAYGKTCAWLLSHPDYIAWLSPAEFVRHRGFLWIRGKPGAGKSTLMKYIFTQGAKSNNWGTTLSFFFNARGGSLEKSTEGMYRSLLFQLLEKLPDLQRVLDNAGPPFRDPGEHRSWDIENLQRLFSAALRILGHGRITCFIDALDECDESEIRDMVEYFEELGDSIIETQGQVYICFSSRHYPTINIQNGRSMVLEEQQGHSQDLEKYVKKKLKAGTGKTVDKIRTELLEKASGVFMWVVLVVDILNKEFERGRIFAVRKRLQETPAELSTLFKDILRRDNNNMADLLLCIQWILYAKRPLKPEEFYYAIVAGLDSPQEYLTAWDPDDTPIDAINRFVSSSSKGLAEVTKSKKAGTVQFIHESVRDFLLKDGGIQELWPDLISDFQSQSHNRIKECCHAYMSIDISRCVSFKQELPKASSEEAKVLRQLVSAKFPLLEYATHHVLYHADAAAADISQNDFLSGFELQVWINLHDLFEGAQIRRYAPLANFLYILAENGLARLVKTIPQSYLRQYNHHGGRYKHPLFAALVLGHQEAARALLQLGIEPQTERAFRLKLQDGRILGIPGGRTTLTLACEKGLHDLVQLFLDSDADIEFRDSHARTPLICAIAFGNIKTIRLLLDKGADIESKDEFGRTPLYHAIIYKHDPVAGLLVESGANFESQAYDGRTPLSIASRIGDSHLVEFFNALNSRRKEEGLLPTSAVFSQAELPLYTD